MATQAYRIYQAAFNRVPDQGGLGFWMNVPDQGATLNEVAAGFESSNEFVAMYGAHPTNAAMVTQFYQNGLYWAPDQGGLDYWVHILDSHADTAAGVLVDFSDSSENKAQWVGVMQQGMEYQAVA